MENIVSVAKIAAMAVSALVGFALPLCLALYWRKRTGAGWGAFFIGAVTFVLFVFVLENLCHQLFIFTENPISKFINSSIWAYAIYGCLASGIFEETGRLMAFKMLLERQNGRETGVMYGIGHGGIEAVLLCSLSMISNIAFAVTLNSGGADALLAAAPEAQAASQALMIETLAATPAWMFLVSGLERIIAVALHIALSVLVFTAVKRGKMIYYPIAILLHALVNSIAMFYRVGYITNVLFMELLVAVATACVCLFAAVVYRADKPKEPAEEAASEA